MTVVNKTIKGQQYLYFQDSVKTEGGTKILNTCISRNDTEEHELLKAKENAFAKHLVKILKAVQLIKKQNYCFEIIPDSDPEELVDILEILKIQYSTYKKALTKEELEEFEKDVFIKYVHGTTAIEGNTLTEEQAFRLLDADLTTANKTVNETLEVANYKDVKEYLKGYSGEVTEKLIKRIHQLLMHGIKGYNGKLINAGEYRTNQAILRNIGFRPPPADAIPDRMRYLLAEYRSKKEKKVHPLELTSYFHQKFEEIHPFQDGNGRVGREILNYILVKEGFPPIYLTEEKESEYLSALQEGNINNYYPLVLFVTSRLTATLRYLLTRTNLFTLVSSSEAREMATTLGTDDLFANDLAKLKKLKESKRLP